MKIIDINAYEASKKQKNLIKQYTTIDSKIGKEQHVIQDITSISQDASKITINLTKNAINVEAVKKIY